MQNYSKSQTRLAFVQYIFQNKFLNTDTSESITQVERIIKKIEVNQKPIAILVKKNSFSKYSFKSKGRKNNLKREKCIEVILDKLEDEDIIISTTGKTSREF